MADYIRDLRPAKWGATINLHCKNFGCNGLTADATPDCHDIYDDRSDLPDVSARQSATHRSDPFASHARAILRLVGPLIGAQPGLSRSPPRLPGVDQYPWAESSSRLDLCPLSATLISVSEQAGFPAGTTVKDHKIVKKALKRRLALAFVRFAALSGGRSPALDLNRSQRQGRPVLGNDNGATLPEKPERPRAVLHWPRHHVRPGCLFA